MKIELAARKGCGTACSVGRPGVCALEGWFCALGLEPALSARFAEGWRSNRYSRGDILFYQDNEPMALYFLCAGRVKLVRSDRAGGRQIIRIIRAPDLAGERALIARQAYAASAEVMEDARVCVIDGGRFFKFWEESPEIVRVVAKRLAAKLGEADVLAVDLARSTIQQRLSKLIVLQAESLSAPKDPAFHLTLSRRELAELLGSSPEVVSRALRELSRRKLIALEGRHVRVLDGVRLRAVSGLPAARLDFYQARSAQASFFPGTVPITINRARIKRGKHDS